MTRLDDIKAAIAGLTDEDRLRLHAWLAEIEAARFDDRIAADVSSGKLDRLIEQARTDHRSGLTPRPFG